MFLLHISSVLCWICTFFLDICEECLGFLTSSISFSQEVWRWHVPCAYANPLIESKILTFTQLCYGHIISFSERLFKIQHYSAGKAATWCTGAFQIQLFIINWSDCSYAINVHKCVYLYWVEITCFWVICCLIILLLNLWISKCHQNCWMWKGTVEMPKYNMCICSLYDMPGIKLEPRNRVVLSLGDLYMYGWFVTAVSAGS